MALLPRPHHRGRQRAPAGRPARYDDLSGLPPAWIGVGTNDLFHDEDVTYARRLQQAGVASTLHVVPGAYHNFDSIEAKAAISRAFVNAQTTALDEALKDG
ncbi:alpha/beta hydrolase fold domain-containing protein [Mesorhizobium sp. M0633]|uniref:alpha/beta hydrolase fold domain-containing protein n=1 Tax=unclassified Mesorhizobium TaxID=325217 RepID=UPI00333E0A11